MQMAILLSFVGILSLSQMGLALLVGFMTKDSILLVEFANQRRAQGANAKNAMLQVAKSTSAPILMTSFTLILGILPVAIGRDLALAEPAEGDLAQSAETATVPAAGLDLNRALNPDRAGA
jgi:multidrug efflux pump subunit AcrB